MRIKPFDFIAVLFLGALIVPAFLHAATAEDLQSKIDTQNQAISQLESEIAKYQIQLGALGTQKNTLSNAVKTLSVQVQQVGTQVKLTGDKISGTNLKIASLDDSIGKTTANIQDLHQAIVKSIQEMHAQDNRSTSEIFVSSRTLSDLWHYSAADDAVRQALREKTDSLVNKKQTLLTDKTQVENAKKELVRLQTELKNQQALVKKNQADKNELLASTKNQESVYQKMLAQKQAQKTQMENDLRSYESQLKYVLNPSELPTTGSNTFTWPLDKVVITQLFGKTSASARLYATGTHNGVDFGIPSNTAVKAMGNGTILGSGNTDVACRGASYGNWILIKYDNGLTAVYGHLNKVVGVTGARVSSTTIVAYSGASGYATGPHLHVSVWPSDGVKITSFPSKACSGRTITIPTGAANAYLDPMVYFPKK
jgi:murein DD-endopeptidase MepM/ murein hydrolase activator NlpD